LYPTILGSEKRNGGFAGRIYRIFTTRYILQIATRKLTFTPPTRRRKTNLLHPFHNPATSAAATSPSLEVMQLSLFVKSPVRFCCFIALTIWSIPNARAEPSFARKYHADCTLCHTVYPHLNRTGYLFRRLGYRLPADVQRRLAPSAAVTPANPAALNHETTRAGADLVQSFYCISCHRMDGKGGTAGPQLDGVASRRSNQYIAEQIKNPKGHNPGSMMPAIRASDDQIAQIVAYLDSLPAVGSQRPERKTNIADYFGASWAPAIDVTQSSGNTQSSYDLRELELFVAGTFGDHFSMFVAALPASSTPGFAGKLDIAQGMMNFGNDQNSSETRFGQLYTLQGAGFGGTDQFVSEGPPLIFFPVNGFAAGRFGRGASEEYMFGDSTTFKVFGVEESDQSRTFGAIWEQLIGSSGLSGVSLEYAGGWNPNLRNGLAGPELHFNRVYVSANKTFEDAHGAERVNVIGGLSFGDDNQLVGGTPNLRSENYGWYGEVDTVPLYRHLGAYFRYDALRGSNLQSSPLSSMMRAATVGTTVNVTKYARVQLEYERFDFFGPSNFYTISFRLNF
jgi:mono/diheme cytochrome c family protein